MEKSKLYNCHTLACAGSPLSWPIGSKEGLTKSILKAQ